MAKFSLLNLLLLTAIIALATSLFFENRNRTVTISSDEVTWTIPQYLAQQSQWIPESGPPALSMEQAMNTANALGEYLNDNHEDTGYHDWRLESISLSRVSDHSFRNFWVYIAKLNGSGSIGGQFEELRIVILLDSSIAFDPADSPFVLATTVRDYPDILYAPNDHRYPAVENN